MWERRSAFGSFVHTPLGPRKSGIPDSVEMPAPVRAMTWRASRIQPAMVARSGRSGLLTGLRTASGAGGDRCLATLLGPARSAWLAWCGLPAEPTCGEHRGGDPPDGNGEQLVGSEAAARSEGVEGGDERPHQVDEWQEAGDLDQPRRGSLQREEDAGDEDHGQGDDVADG